MEELRKLERLLMGVGGDWHLNDIERLYELADASDLKLMAEALKAIGEVLGHHRRRLARANAASGAPVAPEAPIVDWLRQHTEAYHAALGKLATSSSAARAQVCAVRLALAATRAEAEEMRAASARGGTRAAFMLPTPEKRLQELVSELLLNDRWSTQVSLCLCREFIGEYVDIRHYVLSYLKYCADQVGKAELSDPTAGAAQEAEDEPASKKRRFLPPFVQELRARGRTHEELFTRILALLNDIPEPAPKEAKADADDLGLEDGLQYAPVGRPTGQFLKAYRRLYQDVWVQLLSLHVPLSQCVAVLQMLPGKVLPHMSQPLILADFYLRAFQNGSLEVSVQSLSGLLALLTKYGLADPETLSSTALQYYVQLYGLIKPETFKLKKRARFQRLVVASLGSGLLPGRLAGVFAKRCLRVAVLSTEPGTVLWLMSAAHMLIQKHHSHCQELLHRSPEEAATPLAEDPFDLEAPLHVASERMAKTSLWEVRLLQRHHVVAVATLAKLFLKPFFKPTSRKLDPEDFLDQSFEKSFEQALKTAERQASRWEARGEAVPVAFRVEDNAAADRVFGWAAALSTSQRQIGAGR